jgi:thiamine biosynthesis lipoprotein
MGIISQTLANKRDDATNAANTAMPPVPGLPPGVSELRILSFQALGTQCQVQYACAADERARTFEASVVAWVKAFEARYSRFRSDSLVGRINAAAGRAWVEIDPEMEQMLALCDTVHFMSQGILDATALPVLRLWNYKAAPKRLPTDAEIEAAKRLVGWRKVQRAPGRIFLPEPGMELDFGGFGKEWAVDVVARIAKEHGIPSALVDFGHDIASVGLPPGRPAWHVGLEDPLRPGAFSESIAMPPGRGVASSGDYLRHFTFEGRRYGHIVDPRTGRPVANGCLQVTVIADSCLKAGLLSTACFILGLEKGLAHIQSTPGAEGMIIMNTSRGQTRGFWQYLVR